MFRISYYVKAGRTVAVFLRNQHENLVADGSQFSSWELQGLVLRRTRGFTERPQEKQRPGHPQGVPLQFEVYSRGLVEGVEDAAEAADAFLDFGDGVVGEAEAEAVVEGADAGAAGAG